MDNVHSWKGKNVRHLDGRTGVIATEDGFGPWLDLHIQCSDGTKATVTLNARGRDSGEAGWQWWCPDFGGRQAWLPLGEQGAPLEYAGESQDAGSEAKVGRPGQRVR